MLKLDRVLYSSIHYPGDYGFIPQTFYEDGDPLDVLVMVSEPSFPGCVIEARPLGLFRMTDRGLPDEKILAVPVPVGWLILLLFILLVILVRLVKSNGR